MTTMIQCIADRGLIHSSIDVLCRKVEISKTFFYSFFSSKEELVLYGSSSKPSVAKPNETKMFRSVFPNSLKKCCFLP